MGIIQPVRDFEGTRKAAKPLHRVEDVRAAAMGFRQKMLASAPVPFYASLELVRVPYPTKFGYLNGFGLLPPMMHLCNRMFVVQFHSAEGLKTLLASPTDWEHQRETPFFKRLDESMGAFAAVGEKLVFKKTSTVLQRLAELGLKPEDIDYITYDHLHTQNLTRWLGGKGQTALFPNAKLLVMREEWASAQALIPWHNQWYCPEGIAGIPESKVIQLDQDVLLGEGVALIRTKGHTEGNHSIVVHTPEGLKVTSENGVSLDSYDPLHSKVPGVAEYARVTGSEVILNGNTQEYAIDQYISMVQEKTIAGPYAHDARFSNIAPVSEAAGYWLFPRTAPTVSVGELRFGQLQKPIALAKAA